MVDIVIKNIKIYFNFEITYLSFRPCSFANESERRNSLGIVLGVKVKKKLSSKIFSKKNERVKVNLCPIYLDYRTILTYATTLILFFSEGLIIFEVIG